MPEISKGKKRFSFCDVVLILSVLAMVAKVAGFAEKVVIAHYFGTDAFADIYFAATGIILSIVFLVKELVHPSLLPVLTKMLSETPEKSSGLFYRFLFISSLVLVLLGVGIALFSDQLTAVFVPGFSSEKRAQMSSVLRYLSPACIFLSLAMVTYTALNAHKKFLRASIPETGYKILVSLGFIGLIPLWGIKAVPLVLSMASFLLFILMLISFPGKKSWMKAGEKDLENLNKVFRLMGPIVIGVIFSHISGLVDNMLASTLPTGHLAYLSYSKKLIDAILLIGPVALVTVSYPHLASLSHQLKKDYVCLFVKVLRVLIYIGIPGAILIVVLREPIIQLLFERGQFDLSSTVGTSRGLLIYGLGFLTLALESHLVFSFYAFSDTKTPVSVGIGCVILDVILALSLIHAMGYVGIALAFVISKSIKILILGYLLEKKLKFIESGELLSFSIKTAFAAVPSTLLLLYLSRFNINGNLIVRGVIDIMLPALGFFVVFAGFSVLFRIPEMGQLTQLVLCRIGLGKRRE